jgi:arginine deiminase
VLKADLRPLRTRSLKWGMLAADDFLLPPLPNHLFTRDNTDEDIRAAEREQ